jgi:alanine dehydrogenase
VQEKAQVTRTKNIAMQVPSDKDTKKYLAMILKVEPPTLEEIEMMNSQAILISAIQLKTKQKSYFEALTKKNYRSSF